MLRSDWSKRKSCLNPCSNGIWSLTRQACGIVKRWSHVLILVLMEYGLWHRTLDVKVSASRVLILVLMEYGLWPSIVKNHVLAVGLNPCSNGIWSLTGDGRAVFVESEGLNPCSNGIWSLTIVEKFIDDHNKVLILVLMEYGLWQLNIMIIKPTIFKS